MNLSGGEARVALSQQSVELWHRRFGHLNVQPFRKAVLEAAIEGIENVFVPKFECGGCVAGKQHREPFAISFSLAEKLLGFVHSDVCGPLEVQSLGGARYFLTFMDNRSRFCVVRFLKRKSEVPEEFTKFAVEAERGTGQKVLRSDKGGEDRSIQFDNFRSLDYHSSIPYTPEQNGVVERLNRTLMASASSMKRQKATG